MINNKCTRICKFAIAKEGWVFIVALISLTIFSIYYLPLLITIILCLVTLFVIQFFRDPIREMPNNDRAILSPADGKIVLVSQAYDEYRKCDSIKVSIFMNVFNVHSQRSPATGVVKSINYFTGHFFNASLDKSSSLNERNALILELPNKDNITIIQIAGLIARRILCYAKIGQQLKKGERYGFIRFGSRIDIYLPLNYKILVSIGDIVYSQQTIIAEIP